jgi:site-specific DNA-methyltransferase (adenine-specific)
MISIVENRDYREALRETPDKAYDWAVVDPPYYKGTAKMGYFKNSLVSPAGVARNDYARFTEWDVPGNEYYEELCRVSRNQIIWGINYYPFSDQVSGRIVWDKYMTLDDFSDAEIASVSTTNQVIMFRYLWSGWSQGESIKNGMVQQGNKAKNEKRIHPMQKPVKLYQWIFEKFCKPGQSVLDTHVGSGSIRIAAYEFGVDFTGYEISEVHFMEQEKRWTDYQDSLKNTLFYE